MKQIAFQFSHHVLEKDSTIAHKGQWISEERGSFPNFDFVRALKKELEHDRGTIFRYSHHENTVLGQIRKQLQDSEAPDRKPLVQWIESITEPSGKCPDPWQATRPMVDLLELVVRFFWHPRMGGSNSMKVVLPAILEASAYLQAKYSKPVYGAPGGIKSLNYKDHTWLKRGPGGGIQDPYGALPQVFDQWERNTLDRMYSEDELADGGAAMMAYAKMQFSEMSKAETTRIAEALLRYCELDTLAMVMLWEGWLNLENSI
ncbi:MAG: DUF2779 domain-containing protein [Gammaproteobacteria bacterium]